ncbi:tetratricopeptide repeat protein [Acinetobacter johnsonii]|uniref:YbgF trimerization domain-containing protein n=1 Tax=Acinetobacter johnsonii TaxID=40214 RepID=UPI00026241AC|nr:YbgF trimerization domain-containing protein [Acinetobacter johnsonii]QPF33886.1 tetratricopeptide repeat protein [Acinetobacter johnsonii]USI87268.1 tetratricopeptide repeat protein [Acinetobacter johnsonii]
MMLKKHSLCALTLLCTTPVFANIPIESRGLSQATNNSVNPTSVAVDTGASATATNINWQIMQKNQQLESDLRSLRGKLEEQDNEIAQLKHELENRYADLDQRLELLQQKVDPEASTTTEDNQQDTPPSNTTITNPSSNTTAAAVNKAPVVVSTQNTSELEKAAYTVALDAYKQGGAKKAIAPMQNFIKNNPNSVYISNAYFWLAEFNLAIEPTNYAEAKKNYGIVANQYPNSSRAPRAVYQLYNIAKEVDKNTAQANQYKAKLLKQYPKSEEASFFKK